MTHRSPDWSRVNYENLLFVYILNVLKNLRTVSDLIAKSEKFYAKSDLTKLSWSRAVGHCFMKLFHKIDFFGAYDTAR